MNAVTNGTAATTGTTTANLLDNAECIDAYTDCLSQSDVCGSDFEECTTSVLFHAQMPKCLSVLGQCSASGVNALFGTSSTTALSTVKSTNEYDEVTEYTYPTAGSVLGQMIDGARIANMYDTSNCVRRYTTCLQASNVCGADFELCTTNSEFKKQRVYCDSVLARCQSDGKIELFGGTNLVDINNPASTSRIGEMIADGAALAAVNAVSTCYRVADQCILNACAQNPYKCIAGSSRTVAMLADAINNAGAIVNEDELLSASDAFTNSEIQGYIKTACFDTIGANQYCYMTANNGNAPSQAELSDPIEQELVFANIYQSRMNESMRSQLDTIMQDFDQQAKSDCSDTISECVMRTCGGGSGPACYALVFSGNDPTINNSDVYGDLKSGCAAIVNTDANCKYAAANPDSVGGYVYTYNSANAFDTLFPEYTTSSADPIGVVAWLNASLSTSYNDAAINQMKVNCENAAKSCIKTMCGNEYTNCYRNRTDMASTLTNTGNSAFDSSMNKVGGVLDYTIVLGLCLDSVKNASACEEYLDVEAAKAMNTTNNAKNASWGASSARVRTNWLDAGDSTTREDMVPLTDDAGNYVCQADDGSQGPCNQMNNETHQYYDTPVYISQTTYAHNRAAENVFMNLLYDIEKEAQAIYNAKLTQEQNMCMASNSGGIMGAGDMGSTFVWAKLNNNRVPDNYTMDGLKSSQFKASNELYGSFCAVRVTLQSDDATVQNALRGKEWATTYFATGDTFACGSWIPLADLNSLADAAFADKAENQKTLRTWLGVLGGLGGAVGGAYLGAGIADGSVFGKLTGLQKQDTKTTINATTIKDKIDNFVIDNIVVSGREFDKDADYDDISQLESWMSSVDAGWKMVKDQLRNVANIDKQIVNLAGDAVDDWTKAAKEQQKWLKNQETCDAMEAEKRAKRESCGEKRPDVQTLIDAATDAEDKLTQLSNAVDNIDGEVKENRITRTQVGSIIGAGVGAAATATIVALAARDIQDAQMDAEQQAWLDEMGSRLKCYVGTTEAGQYGDIISITLEQ